jgi:2-oxoglutarate dehydrogenase E1 component
MDKFSYLNNANGAFIDNLYKKFQKDPSSVDELWQKFFEGYEFSNLGNQQNSTSSVDAKEISVLKLINAYRTRGHLLADTNPVRDRRKHRADLDLSYFDLSKEDFDTKFKVSTELSLEPGKTLNEILEHLEKTYCGPIGVEFRHIRDSEKRQWLYKRMEPVANDPQFSKDQKKHILEYINKSVMFENFLHTKYVGQKRFSLEGLESFIPALNAAIESGADLGVREFVLGMAHRGRLNVLVNIFRKTYENIFSEFEGNMLPESVGGDGDVKYHLGKSADIETKNGHKVHLTLTANPSHLEAVNPVVEGRARGRCDQIYNGNRKLVAPILVHGDAAIAGQGIIYEVSNLMNLEGYTTGGTVHVVLNNQIGFTANYKESRSSIYCTDIAKVTESPIFHVNADKPEAVVHAMQIAMEYRQKFNVDVYVDILGYRRYGHNEGDEPRFTQPNLYEKIKKHKNVYEIYLEKLIKTGVLTKDEEQKESKNLKNLLQGKLDEARQHKKDVEVNFLAGQWKSLRQATGKDFEQSIKTGYSEKELEFIAKKLITVPDDFNLFSKMKRLFSQKEKLFFQKNQVDWGLAELLAYGSLLVEGHGVRISGQDSQRGTFSHRHSVILDEKTEEKYIPLNNIQENQAKYEAYNSHLSEYGVLGFEYGYSLVAPEKLVIWEAQFGDFSNGAQIIFDQFISSSESKWQRMSGLVVMLPHGYEGQGPEHSSARIERYLQLCGQDNMIVAQPSTPANFFHLLRRQIKQPYRKPLIVFTPKSLLRHPKVVSDIKDLTKGKFEEIIDDTSADPKKVKKVVICSGKIYYDILEQKEKRGRNDIALVRLEQYYPFSKKAFKKIEEKYKNAPIFFAQDEPENMGAWIHVFMNAPIKFAGVYARRTSASPSTGSAIAHQRRQNNLIEKIFRNK